MSVIGLKDQTNNNKKKQFFEEAVLIAKTLLRKPSVFSILDLYFLC